ncbi:MAG: response regulator [Planctomycetota bacterium]
MKANQYTLLLVDDNNVNLIALEDNIQLLGHRTILADGGKAALAILEKRPVDMVLLDVMMPEMDGFQVLQHIRESEKTKNVPVIMISALDEIEVAATCIKHGADDYLFKPFNRIILEARVTSGLEKKRLHDLESFYKFRLEQNNAELTAAVERKTKELELDNRKLMTADGVKNDFIQLLSRELQAPLYGLFDACDMLFENDPEEGARQSYISVYRDACARIETILEHAALITKLQSDGSDFTLEPIPLKNLFSLAIDRLEATKSGRAQLPKFDIQDTKDAAFLGQRDLHSRAFSLIFESAARFLARDEKLNIRYGSDGRGIQLDIYANGRTLPVEALEKFFDINAISDPATTHNYTDIGLGPVLSERIIRMFGGELSIENTNHPGIAYRCKLMQASQA